MWSEFVSVFVIIVDIFNGIVGRKSFAWQQKQRDGDG
jgi:hypothetical protein